MTLSHRLACIALALAASTAGAQDAAAPPSAASVSAPTARAGTPAATDGEVRKVDKPAGKLTLRHGRIEHLDMPGMTMVFRVADPTLLETLKEGDRVRFTVDRVDGALTVTRIEPQR